MSLPVILRHEAEFDIPAARDQLEADRVGLGNQVLARVRDVLARIEKMPELHGEVWEDVRAARLKQFRYIVCFIVLADRVEVLAVLHSVRNPSAWQSRGQIPRERRTRRWSSLAITYRGMVSGLVASC